MRVSRTDLPGVLLLEPRVFRDERGFFAETFNASVLSDTGIPAVFLQDNHSRSVRGVIRGLHFQLHRPQGKLVHVTRGRIFDVAVDIRRGSPSFGRWTGVELDDENLASLWVPAGFAHGFCALSDVADVVYKCTEVYDRDDDRGVLWSDPDIAIAWPRIPPLVSEKDSHLPRLNASSIELPEL